MAYDLQDHTFCYKIFEKSYSGAGWAPQGYKIWYLQSQCLFDLAQQTKNPFYCNDVKPIRTFFRDGSKYSTENCIKEIKERPVTDGVGHSFDYTILMTTLGYTEEMWNEHAKDEYNLLIKNNVNKTHAADSAWQIMYLKVSQTDDFRNRLKKLPTFTE